MSDAERPRCPDCSSYAQGHGLQGRWYCGLCQRTIKENDDMAIIPEAAAFTAAATALAEHDKAARDLTIDVAIAERGSDADAINAAKAAQTEHGKNWYPLYTARRDTAKALVEALGVDGSALKASIQ